MGGRFESQISFDNAHILQWKYRNLRNIPHWHREYEIIYVCKGTAKVTVNGSLFTLSENMSVLVDGNSIHSIYSEEGAEVAVAKIESAFMRGIVSSKNLVSPLLTREFGVYDFFSLLFAEQRLNDIHSGAVCDARLTLLISDIFRREETKKYDEGKRKEEKRHRELLDRIANGYAYMTFSEAAAYMHFSEPYFSKYFLAHTGMTFTRYLSVIRVANAARMLKEGEMSVTEISRACGFGTIRNFNRVFKSVTGYSPSSLPSDFSHIGYNREYTGGGFDPTLDSSEIIEWDI